MIKKLISSILITLLFITNVFATNQSVSINIQSNTANITLNGIDKDIHALQLDLIDNNNNNNISFIPNKKYNYSNTFIKKENGKTNISIIIDNGQSLTQNGTLNIGKLEFSGQPNISSNVKLELVDLDEDLKGNLVDVTANISISENNNNNSSSNSGGSSSGGSSFSGGDSNSGKQNNNKNDNKTESTTNNNQNNQNNQNTNNKIDINTLYPVVKNSNFSDINGHWANNSIKYLADRGIINGMSDSIFAPNNNITRAEFVTLLAKMDKINENKYKADKFIDVPSNAWFNPYVDWAFKTGITSGISSNQFAPNNKITREQMAVMIEKFATYKNFSLSENKAKINFKDSSSISNYAQNSVVKVQQAGIINGRPDGSFAPKDNATRAEAAQIIYTMLTIQ